MPARGRPGGFVNEDDPDASLQIEARALARQIQAGDPAIERIGRHAETARQPVRTAERSGGMEKRVDEIRHGAM